MRVLVVLVVLVVVLVVTGVKQSQLLGLRLSLEFDKIWVDDRNGGGLQIKQECTSLNFAILKTRGGGGSAQLVKNV